MRKFIGKFLAAGLCVAMALSSVTVKADSVDQKYLALGADLTVSQKKKVLELLDLDDNSDYKVITVTNKDEHEFGQLSIKQSDRNKSIIFCDCRTER